MTITKSWRSTALAAALLLGASAAIAKPAASPLPQLREQHGATQLVVDGKPFLLLGGELDNSSASSEAYMQPIWKTLPAMNINTVFVPAYWELLEPSEGKFDFRSVDSLIANARKHKLHVVLLWFGSWKNSMSSYAPAWVKRDPQRFPRAARSNGASIELLSALGEESLRVDRRAFVTLMQHLRAIDSVQRTVVMVQPENEVGMVDDAREHSALANAAFAAPVPAQLTDYLAQHKETLQPALKDAWQTHGFKVGASWEETFGAGLATDELFNAWTQARFTGMVAAAGKAVYPLPMYVNAALIRPGFQPGQYISGGPLPHLFDVWHAAAPALDILSPDLYFPNAGEWAQKYKQPGNPLLVPETGRASGAEMGVTMLWAFGALDAIGLSPYAPEFLNDDDRKAVTAAFGLIKQMTPFILEAQGRGKMIGVRPPVAFDGRQNLAPQTFTLGRYSFEVRFKNPPPISIGQKEDVEMPGSHGGLIVQTGPDEFLVAGTGMNIYFGTTGLADPIAGIESIWEGQFVNGKWVAGRCMNGDESNQGRQLKVPTGIFTIHKVRLYHYH